MKYCPKKDDQDGEIDKEWTSVLRPKTSFENEIEKVETMARRTALIPNTKTIHPSKRYTSPGYLIEIRKPRDRACVPADNAQANGWR